jgi:glycosyltransferase involved in cell wall biosynthesis
MDKLRILHITNPVSIPVTGYGGTERVVYTLAKMQAEEGHDVAIIAGAPSIIPKVKDLSFAKGSPYAGRIFIIRRLMNMYSLKAYLESRKYNFDIIHNHISEEAIPASILSNSNSKVITTLHSPLSLRKFWPFITTSTAAILPKKTKLVAISKRAFMAYKPFFGNNLLTYIYHGIDPASIPFNPKPQKNHEVQLCFLGQIAPQKRPHLAIRVAEMLYEKKYDVELFIMGKMDYPLTNYVKKIISMVKIRKYIKILPNIRTEEMYKILGNCDALLAVSAEIGLGLAHLEALATGTPLVGLVDGPAVELIKHGVNGYLGTNLEELAKYSSIAMELDRSKCRSVVEEEFSAKVMNEKYLDLYNMLLENSR